MGGVDKSYQFISYNRITRRTKRYGKTMFYCLLEIITTNSSIIHCWLKMNSKKKRTSETLFRDRLVLQIISKYGRPVTSIESFNIRHGSQLINSRSKFVFCRKNNTMRKCPNCPFQLALCQVSGRDCHSIWHSTSPRSLAMNGSETAGEERNG